MFHVAVLLLQPLHIASGRGSTSNPVGRPTLCIVLQTWRASAWEAITSDFADLQELISTRVSCMYLMASDRCYLTLQRSQACPVLEEFWSRFLTALETSSGCSTFTCLFGEPSGSSAARFFGIFTRQILSGQRRRWRMPWDFPAVPVGNSFLSHPPTESASRVCVYEQ
jgi:hypothetical protein